MQSSALCLKKQFIVEHLYRKMRLKKLLGNQSDNVWNIYGGVINIWFMAGNVPKKTNLDDIMQFCVFVFNSKYFVSFLKEDFFYVIKKTHFHGIKQRNCVK